MHHTKTWRKKQTTPTHVDFDVGEKMELVVYFFKLKNSMQSILDTLFWIHQLMDAMLTFIQIFPVLPHSYERMKSHMGNVHVLFFNIERVFQVFP